MKTRLAVAVIVGALTVVGAGGVADAAKKHKKKNRKEPATASVRYIRLAPSVSQTSKSTVSQAAPTVAQTETKTVAQTESKASVQQQAAPSVKQSSRVPFSLEPLGLREDMAPPVVINENAKSVSQAPTKSSVQQQSVQQK